jgi:palmitoyl-protein thioesterase
VEFAAQELAGIPELRGGFDALGLSQGERAAFSIDDDSSLCATGGQFLRAYVERYNTPSVHNLITFGSQHMGVSDLPLCAPRDFLCHVARRAAKGAVYSEWAQNTMVQVRAYLDGKPGRKLIQSDRRNIFETPPTLTPTLPRTTS